ncbi:ORF2 [Fowl aviadenovirus A]|uniref:Uncharacterized protein ORF2 n=2 Tax=Fowl aviadenovirus A TaxID=190061 RepID=YO2_ADEG1|nr:Rep protein [Fowl aviadenovirus A]AP_000405.1 ORF2 [Fowl aviadenovirus A]Q89621.1 RecName: Full=Uncharacterized protein ORF2 [Fowl aviadenovirus 1]AAB26433.1 31.5 kda polypeptide [Fowl aviadenovirus 1]AAC54897.1 ORF2 [Fowl aviadenovirus 1]AZI71468.1 ORF2 [Fowl aviadenovirus A]QGQ63288.1 ORF2 [Fowl aviadenovirus A]QNH85914.1 Per protein [Fowl aviadenovirus A]
MSRESERYWTLVHALIDRGVVSREQWQMVDPAQYQFYHRSKQRGFKVRHILRDVIRHMCWSRTLLDYMSSASTPSPDDVLRNPLYQLLLCNGYNPAVVGTALIRWAGHQSNRNTVWIRGTPMSGAPYLAQAIAYCSPLVGSVDWRNKSNPFEGCPDSLVFWWDGGYVYDCCVGLVKQVFRGEHVILPPEGLRGPNPCSELFRTPVLMYSQADICMTRLRSGELSAEHAVGLRDCMYLIRLTEDFDCAGGISCADVKQFVAWSREHPGEVRETHELK